MKTLLTGLKGAPRSVWIVLLGGTVLMTGYLYLGHHTVFTRHLAPSLTGADHRNDWFRHSYQFVAAFVLLGVGPALLAWLGLGRRPGSLGVGLGDWRAGLKLTAIGMVALTPVLYLASMDPAMQREYPLTRLAGCGTDLFLLWELHYLVYYAAWEFFFRGFMLFPLEDEWGSAAAILVQTVPSTLVHLGKPGAETSAAIVAGLLFGALAIRTRSVVYPILLHWFVGMATDFFCLLNMIRP